jgi:hypothetical protein
VIAGLEPHAEYKDSGLLIDIIGPAASSAKTNG